MRPFLACLILSGCAFDPLGPGAIEDASPADAGADAGSDAGFDGGPVEPPDAGPDAGSPIPVFHVNRDCFDDDTTTSGPGDAGLRLRCAGLATMGSLPAPTSGVRLREAGFALGVRVCQGQKCVTGGIVP